MSNTSFVDLLASLNGTTKEAEEFEPSAETSTEGSTETPAEASSDASATEDVTETTETKSAADLLGEMSDEISGYADKIASVIEDEYHRELFGSSLQSVIMLKAAGLMKEGHGTDAKSLVSMANDLFKKVRDL